MEYFSLIVDLLGIIGFFLGGYSFYRITKLNNVNSSQIVLKKSPIKGDITGRDKSTSNGN